MARSLNLKLKSLRVMKDLTQEEFSKILGMHEVTYNVSSRPKIATSIPIR